MSDIKSCSFCEELESLKSKSQWVKNEVGVTRAFKCCIAEETYTNGQLRGNVVWKRHTLKYCPSCGKKVEVSI